MGRARRSYNVSLFGQFKQQLNALREQAIQLGIEAEFSSAVKWIEKRLSKSPSKGGDPLYRLRHLELMLYRGTHTPLNVIYAVDEQRKLVYLTQVSPMPGHGYSQET